MTSFATGAAGSTLSALRFLELAAEAFGVDSREVRTEARDAAAEAEEAATAFERDRAASAWQVAWYSCETSERSVSGESRNKTGKSLRESERERERETHHLVDDDSVPPDPLFLLIGPLAFEPVLTNRTRFVAQPECRFGRPGSGHGDFELLKRGAVDRPASAGLGRRGGCSRRGSGGQQRRRGLVRRRERVVRRVRSVPVLLPST